jgi:hypothetical protein
MPLATVSACPKLSTGSRFHKLRHVGIAAK